MLGDSVRRRTQAARRPRPTGSTGRGRILPEWSWRRWLPVLLTAALLPFIVGYAIAAFMLFPAPPAVEGGIPVPDLVSRMESEAARQLTSLGLGRLETTPLPHPSEPPGTVIAQSPLPGQQLKPGRPVRAAVSAGVPRAIVPDVAGFTEGRAAQLLRRMGFEIGRQVQESEEPVGHVIRTNPTAGSDLALPARITIVISSGPPAAPAPDTSGARWPQDR